MPYEIPNHTQTPNELFDEHMRTMTGAEIKVVLAVCRKTFGWHKSKDKISLSQLEELTGLSRPSVIAGINKAIDRGVLERKAVDGSFEYSLVLIDSKKSLLADSKKSLLGSKGRASKKSLHTKEKVKESKSTKEKQKKRGVINNKSISRGSKKKHTKTKRIKYLEEEFADFIE